MTKPELQASERAMRAAEEVYKSLISPISIQPESAFSDRIASIIETTCHLRELERVCEVAQALMDDSAVNARPGLHELRQALATLDAAKEGK